MTSKLTFSTVVSMIENNNFKYYPDENQDPNIRIRKNAGKDFYCQCFNILKYEKNSHELRNKKIKSLEKFEIILKNLQRDNLLPLIQSISREILKLKVSITNYKIFYIEAKSNYNLTNETLTNIFAYIVLDSLIRNNTAYWHFKEGLQPTTGIQFLISSINHFLKHNSNTLKQKSVEEFQDIVKALNCGLQFNLILDDYYTLGEPKLENHLGYALNLILNQLNRVKFVFLPICEHFHCINLIVSKNQDKFKVVKVNTGLDCAKVDINLVLSKYTNDLNMDEKDFLEYFTCQEIFENVSESTIENIIAERFTPTKSYTEFSNKLTSNLLAKGIKRIKGDIHHAQLGYSCVLKSMMRSIHGTISNEVDFRAFKLHMTKNLYARAFKNSKDLLAIQPLITKMIKDGMLIYKKRKIKLEIAKILNSSEYNQDELNSLKARLNELPKRFYIETQEN